MMKLIGKLVERAEQCHSLDSLEGGPFLLIQRRRQVLCDSVHIQVDVSLSKQLTED